MKTPAGWRSRRSSSAGRWRRCSWGRLLGFGPGVYGAMGGRGAALDAALAYSNVLFCGALLIWSNNVLSAVVRGAGNMLLPALTLLASALVHLLLCPLLVFGWGAGAWPRGGRGCGQHAVHQCTVGGGLGGVPAAPRRRGAIAPIGVALAHSPAARHPARGPAGLVEPGAQQRLDRRRHRARRQLRHRGAGGLRHRRAARIHLGADGLRVRHRVDGDGRQQHGRRPDRACAASHLDRSGRGDRRHRRDRHHAPRSHRRGG